MQNSPTPSAVARWGPVVRVVHEHVSLPAVCAIIFYITLMYVNVLRIVKIKLLWMIAVIYLLLFFFGRTKKNTPNTVRIVKSKNTHTDTHTRPN